MAHPAGLALALVFGVSALIFFVQGDVPLDLKTILIAHVVFNASVVALVVISTSIPLRRTGRPAGWGAFPACGRRRSTPLRRRRA